MFTDTEQKAINKALRILEAKATYYSGDSITSSKAAIDYCKLKLFGKEREVFGVLFLSTQHTLIRYEDVFLGTIDQSPVFPREILKKALEYNAKAVVLTHNHPSGIETPSQSDKDITKVIKKALSVIDVEVLDHVIVGADRCFSFADAGMI
jgi:DNA repair protein RadC